MSNMHKYQIIEEYIKTNIENGNFKNGETIYSEPKLAKMFKVTRVTVRQAISNLVGEGYLYKIKGSGTYVSDKKIIKDSLGLTSFTEDMELLGKSPHSKVLSMEVIESTESHAKKLQINPKDLVFRIERIRFADDEPWGYEIVIRPFHFTPNLKIKDIEKSMFADLKSRGFDILYSDQTIEALLAFESTAKHLEIKAGSPLLLIKSITYLKENVPLQYTKSFYRGDRYKFSNRAFRDK
ncbi:GntR family transcriptional regulator [Clostridium sp. D2Q-11]|uniref:GntR family transcriptional regulator n=1 Tax=Anaeromonas frigoriresistens TaxID=2683708 RepID=A0A942UWI1_9FIRM|nr:GntR family transcriptional regulator [Anaeromonas frigoriresistens]MBS4536892.1 GntR family transcriptional regulator [Anaeromonas frigoriresistens]